MTEQESCAYPWCRSTTIDILWLGVPLCQTCYAKLDSMSQPNEVADGQLSLEDFKNKVKVK